MIKENKTVFSVLFILLVSLLFVTAAFFIDKKNEDGNKSVIDSEKEKRSAVLPGYVSYEKTGLEYDGVDDIYIVEIKKGRKVYLITASYKGFSQTAEIAACFEGTELLGVTKLSLKGVPSYYDERALDSDYLSNFKGTLSTDPNFKNADREYIEIEPLSEYDAAGAALLNCVDSCCKAYYDIVYGKGGENR